MSNTKLNFAFVCDHASFSDGGKLNIIGIFKNINALQIPAVHVQMFFVANFIVKTPGEYEEIVKLVRNKDNMEIITPLVFNFTTTQEDFEVGLIGQINNTNFEEEGNYKFCIFVKSNEKEELVGEVPLIIEKNKVESK